MRCEEIMKRDVVIVGAEDTLEKAARVMREHVIGFLPVCDASGGHAIGAVTDRDLIVRGLAEGLSPTSPIADVMTSEVVSCGPFDDLEQAEALMARHKKSRVVVADAAGCVMGIISLSDLAQHESATQAGATLRRVTWRKHDSIQTRSRPKCVDVMKREVAHVGPDDQVLRAAQLMRDRDVGFLPVCQADGKIVGVITDRDLAVRVVADRLDPTTAVRQVMNREVVACAADDDLTRAEDLMAKHRKSRLAVCDADDRVIGVISLSDVAKREDRPEAAGTTLRHVSAREAT